MRATDNSTFGVLVTDVTRLLRKRFDRRAASFNLTRSQWRALRRLQHREGLRQAELAELLEMEAIAVGRVIDRLQKAGFVERRADPADRRAWRLFLTPRARGVTDGMELISAELMRQARRGISPADMKTMMGVLRRMKANLNALGGRND